MGLFIETDYNSKQEVGQDLAVQKKIIKENMYVSYVIKKELDMKVMLDKRC